MLWAELGKIQYSEPCIPSHRPLTLIVGCIIYLLVYFGVTCLSPKASVAISWILYFWTLPVTVSGNSVTIDIYLGTLYLASCKYKYTNMLVCRNSPPKNNNQCICYIDQLSNNVQRSLIIQRHVSVSIPPTLKYKST